MKYKLSFLAALLGAATLQAECEDCTCCNHWDLSVSPLFWQAHEDGLDYMIKNQSGLAFINNHGSVKRINFNWDWGVRVGLGYQTDCIGDLEAEWTYFSTSAKDSTSADFPAGLFSVWTIPGSSITPSTKAKARWKLDLNRLDVKLGVTLFPTCYLKIKPYIALSTAWIDQKFNINSSGGVMQGPAAFVVLDDDINMNNDFWGIGPKVGLDTTWYLGCGFSLVGNFDFSILYGRFDLDQTESILFQGITPATVYLDLKNDDFWISRVNLDFLLGVKWEYIFCDCCYSLSVEAGWENLYFFGQNQLKRFVDDSNPGMNVSTNGDLTFQGLTLKVNFGF